MMKFFCVSAVVLCVAVIFAGSASGAVVSFSSAPVNGNFADSRVGSISTGFVNVQTFGSGGNLQARLITTGQVTSVIGTLTQGEPGKYVLDVEMLVNDAYAVNPKAFTDGALFGEVRSGVNISGHVFVDHLNDFQGDLDVGWMSLDFPDAIPLSATAIADYAGDGVLKANYHFAFIAPATDIASTTRTATSSIVPEPAGLALLAVPMFFLKRRR